MQTSSDDIPSPLIGGGLVIVEEDQSIDRPNLERQSPLRANEEEERNSQAVPMPAEDSVQPTSLTTRNPCEEQSSCTADNAVCTSSDHESPDSLSDDILFIGKFPRIKSEQHFEEERLLETAKSAELPQTAACKEIENEIDEASAHPATHPDIPLRQQDLLRDLKEKVSQRSFQFLCSLRTLLL